MNLSRCLLRTQTRWLLVQPPGRSYALSRLPKKHTGTGRARDRPAPIHPNPTSDSGATPHNPGSWFSETTPSVDESELWRAAQRPPTSDPEHGLKHLLLDSDTLVIEREIEMLNIFVGFEQANKYSIQNEHGETLGYIMEEPKGILSMLSRQAFATHRPFRAIIMDPAGTPLLGVRRPFSWINSKMFVQRLKNYDTYTEDGEPVLDTFAEVQQIWHLWRRKYDLFLREKTNRVLSLASEIQPEPPLETFTQIGEVDSGFLSWTFLIRGEQGEEIGLIDRAFRGIGREIFTDTGRYSVHFRPQLDAQAVSHTRPHSMGMGTLDLDRRALLLALAMNIDFDYFSRHSSAGPGGGMFHVGGWD